MFVAVLYGTLADPYMEMGGIAGAMERASPKKKGVSFWGSICWQQVQGFVTVRVWLIASVCGTRAQKRTEAEEAAQQAEVDKASSLRGAWDAVSEFCTRVWQRPILL